MSQGRDAEGALAGVPAGPFASFTISDAGAARRVRHRVRILLGGGQLQPVADTAADLVGELVRAALPHPRRRADVRLIARTGVLRAEVSGSHLFPPRRPDDEDVGDAPVAAGRYAALPALLEARAWRWGCRDSAAGGTVWFELWTGQPTPGRLPVPAPRPATG